MTCDLVFFLGGYDLEMVTIRELLEKEAAGCFHDKLLSWSAKASAYLPEIVQALEQGRRPVLIELVNDLEEPLKSDPRLIHVDHHGSQRGLNARTALHQVFVLLGLPASRWTRWYDLVSVNDWAYLPGLMEFGATKEEIEDVRRRDRAAQGVTPEEEAGAIRAIERAEYRFGGRLIVVRIASHRTSPVTDRLEPLRPGLGAENVFIVSPGEVNFSGEGWLVLGLAARFPGGWMGGALPLRGYWGSVEAGEEDVLEYLKEALTSRRPTNGRGTDS
ncbi:MAG: hypothetical protein L6R30_22035 [Thermoanaerobaculia bacterium]|nr:hypothetical protein [Thermoanaerobaculia bacterium]